MANGFMGENAGVGAWNQDAHQERVMLCRSANLSARGATIATAAGARAHVGERRRYANITHGISPTLSPIRRSPPYEQAGSAVALRYAKSSVTPVSSMKRSPGTPPRSRHVRPPLWCLAERGHDAHDPEVDRLDGRRHEHQQSKYGEVLCSRLAHPFPLTNPFSCTLDRKSVNPCHWPYRPVFSTLPTPGPRTPADANGG